MVFLLRPLRVSLPRSSASRPTKPDTQNHRDMRSRRLQRLKQPSPRCLTSLRLPPHIDLILCAAPLRHLESGPREGQAESRNLAAQKCAMNGSLVSLDSAGHYCRLVVEDYPWICPSKSRATFRRRRCRACLSKPRRPGRFFSANAAGPRASFRPPVTRWSNYPVLLTQPVGAS